MFASGLISFIGRARVISTGTRHKNDRNFRQNLVESPVFHPGSFQRVQPFLELWTLNVIAVSLA